MRLFMRQAFLLSMKDTRLFLKDRFALGFALLFPILFIVAFSLALGDLGPEDEELRMAVVTEEESGFSRQAIDALTSVEASGVDEWDPKDAGLALHEGRIPGYLLFPVDFTQRIFSGESAEIWVVTADGDPETEAVLGGLARSIGGRIGTLSLAARGVAELEGITALDLAKLGEVGAAPPSIFFTTEQVGNVEPFNATNFTLPGYLTMFLFFAAALGAEAIARERQTQTLERLLSNGVRRSAIVAGKVLASIYRGLIQLAFLWALGIFAFSIDFGASPVAVIAVSVLMAVASSAFGVMLASLVRTVKSASSAAVLASLTLAPLGGCWWPLFITPDWMQAIGRVTPHGWANDAFNKLMLFGAEGQDVLANMAALLLFTAAFLAIAVARFRTVSAN
jgi:ABC-2 type transport system permease protein